MAGSTARRNTILRERRIARPFENCSPARLRQKVNLFMETSGIPTIDRPHVERGALLSQAPTKYRPLSRNQNHGGENVQSDTDSVRTSADDHFGQIEAINWVDSDGFVLVEPRDLAFLDLEQNATMEAIWKALLSSVKQLFTRQNPNPGQSMKPWQAYPGKLYWLVMWCCMSAVVQGFDETVVNGAQSFFSVAFHLESRSTLLGAIVGAPYIVAAFACLFTHWLNRFPFFVNGRLGRRGVISFACLISFVSCLAQGFTNSWTSLLIARLILGLGIGPKSSTVPIYASECAPFRLRGAATTLWQMWTAFGLMCGFIASLVVWKWHDQWKWMLGSPCILPLFPMVAIWFMPESPRFLLQCAKQSKVPEKKAKYIQEALESLITLNKTKVQAYRELFSLWHSLEFEPEESWHEVIINPLRESRTKLALVASTITMLLQQFSAVNVLAYYSVTIVKALHGFIDGDEDPKTIQVSLGLGIVNFIFAIPAFFLMDTFGRRNLLLVAFPLLGTCLAIIAGTVGGSDQGQEASTIVSIIFMFIFFVIYSFSVGPVPFTYASESMPLYHRDQGMGYATFLNWTFNFLLAFSWLPMTADNAMKPWGGFLFYSLMCFVGWFLVLFFVRETKGRQLESMGQVFSMSIAEYVSEYAWPEMKFWIRCVMAGTTQFPDRPNFEKYIDDKQRDALRHGQNGHNDTELQNFQV